MTTKAATGLAAALGKSKTAAKPAPEASPAAAPAAAQADKGVVFRLSPGDWKRLKELALERETTLQQLIEDGVNRLLADRGLLPIGTSRRKPRGR